MTVFDPVYLKEKLLSIKKYKMIMWPNCVLGNENTPSFSAGNLNYNSICKCKV